MWYILKGLRLTRIPTSLLGDSFLFNTAVIDNHDRKQAVAFLIYVRNNPGRRCLSTALNVVENNHLRLTRKNIGSHDNVILKRGDFKNVFLAGDFLTARDRRAEARLRLRLT